MRRKISFAIFILLVVFVLSACSSNTKQESSNELVGYWVEKSGLSISFTEDKQVRYGDKVGTYSIYDNSKILLNLGDTALDFSFEKSEEKLVLTNLETLEIKKYYIEGSSIFEKIKRKTTLTNTIENSYFPKCRTYAEEQYDAIYWGSINSPNQTNFEATMEKFGGEKGYIDYITVSLYMDYSKATREDAEILYSEYQEMVGELELLDKELEEY